MFMANLKQINRKLLINFSDNTPNYCTFITFYWNINKFSFKIYLFNFLEHVIICERYYTDSSEGETTIANGETRFIRHWNE